MLKKIFVFFLSSFLLMGMYMPIVNAEENQRIINSNKKPGNDTSFINLGDNERVDRCENENINNYPFKFTFRPANNGYYNLVFENTDYNKEIKSIDILIGTSDSKDEKYENRVVDNVISIENMLSTRTYYFTLRYIFSDGEIKSYLGQIFKDNWSIEYVMEPILNKKGNVYESEPNNTISKSDTISDDDNVKGKFSINSDKYDYYKVKFNKKARANFYLGNIPSGCDYDLYVYDKNHHQIAYSSKSGSTSELIKNKTVKKNEWYYIKVLRYDGTSNSKYLLRTKSYPYGNRSYDSNGSTQVHCDGYALNYYHLIYADNDLGITEQDLSDCSTKGQLLNLFKNRFQSFMSSKSGIEYRRISSYDSLIDVDEYRVVLRVGYRDANKNDEFDFEVDPFDYHWWYQTETGQWANKHGSTPSNSCSGTDGDTNPHSYHGDWYNNSGNFYYSSNCVYYAIKNDTNKDKSLRRLIRDEKTEESALELKENKISSSKEIRLSDEYDYIKFLNTRSFCWAPLESYTEKEISTINDIIKYSKSVDKVNSKLSEKIIILEEFAAKRKIPFNQYISGLKSYINIDDNDIIEKSN